MARMTMEWIVDKEMPEEILDWVKANHLIDKEILYVAQWMLSSGRGDWYRWMIKVT